MRARSHRRALRLGLAALACVATLLGIGRDRVRAVPPGEDGRVFARGSAALGALQVEEAARLLEPLAARHGDDPDVLFELAMLRMHRGAYGAAVQAIEASIARGTDAPDLAARRELRALLVSTRDATASFVEARSPDGRFVVRHAPGRDALLVPYAFDALAGADRALTTLLGTRVPGPVRLEIFPNPEALARVSSLTVAEIERTGTVALCKWDRLMITSPRALLRGYPWMNTIGHEYVHLVLARASRDRAPVWFQEGVARYLEPRWRGAAASGPLLDPASEALLAKAVRAGELLPFERLHPSIARLASQEQAALAFAQVATFIESFVRRHGDAKLRDAVARIATGTDAREAVAAAAGRPFAALEADWKAELRARPAPPDDSPSVLGLRFRRGDGASDETADVRVTAARRFVRLGDLLWARERPRAAAAEYAKARATATDDPIVASRFARAALAGGDARSAAEALRTVVQRHPEHAPTHAVLGAARLALGELVAARAALREALWLNPFDPAPHCALAEATDLPAERERERAACRALQGDAP
jgi:tetratricopeptide (TPR) repeat protein